MHIQPTRRHRGSTTRVAVFAALLVALGVVSAPGIGRGTPTASAATGTGLRVEGERLAGSSTPVRDAAATNGTAVQTTGTLSTPANLPAGNYLLTVRVRSAGAWMQLAVDGRRASENLVSGGWRRVSAPVYVSGPAAVVAVSPVTAPNGTAPAPLVVDWLTLRPTAPGYTTVGNVIRTPAGQPFVPRGVNRNGYELTPDGYWMSDYDYSWMAKWGATMVRLHPPSPWFSSPPPPTTRASVSLT